MDRSAKFVTPWSDRLALDVALVLEGSGEAMDEVLERHNVTTEQMRDFEKDPVFLKKISALRDDVRTNGMTFKLKAKAQAEELLTTSWMMIHDVDVSPAVKADLIKSTVKWAGYEPKNDTTVDVGAGVKITINLGNTAPEAVAQPASEPKVIDVTPETSSGRPVGSAV